MGFILSGDVAGTEAYCLVEKRKVTLARTRNVRLRNGSKAVKGMDAHGHNVTKIVSGGGRRSTPKVTRPMPRAPRRSRPRFRMGW